jgi:hypothetical protein
VQKGRRPNATDAYWEAAGRELTPLTSLERIDSKAGFVLGNITLFGTILAGLGALGGTTGRLAVHRGAATTVVWLVLLSILCALAANLPSLRTRIDPDNIAAVRQFFTRNIVLRGWLTRIALLLFCAAFLVSVGLLLQVAGARPEPSLALQWRSTGDAERALVARVAVSELPPGARAETVLVSEESDGNESVLATDVAVAGSSGALAVTIEVDDVAQESTVRLSLTVTDDGRPVADGEVVLRP